MAINPDYDALNRMADEIQAGREEGEVRIAQHVARMLQPIFEARLSGIESKLDQVLKMMERED